MMEVLIENGANLNAVNNYTNQSALIRAILGGISNFTQAVKFVNLNKRLKIGPSSYLF